MRSLLILGCLLAGAYAQGEPNAEPESDPREQIGALVRAARDPDRGVRYAAVQALGKAGGKEVVDALVAALDDPEWCVRQAAGHALAQVGQPSVETLARVAREGRPDARVEAIEALRRIGPETYPHWRAALADEDPRVVFEALAGYWFHRRRDPEAIAAIEALHDAADEPVRVLSHFAILVVKDWPDEERDQREGSAIAVGSNHEWAHGWAEYLRKPPDPDADAPRPFSLKDLARDAPHQRARALAAIRRDPEGHRMHAETIEPLLVVEDEGILRDVVMAQELLGRDPRPKLVAQKRWNALRFCRPLEGDLAATAAAEPMPESVAAQRDWAVVIGRAGSAGAKAEPQLRALSHAEDEEVRAAAVWARAMLGKPVSAAVGDRSAAVREIAARYADDEERLRGFAQGPDREVAALALRRLGELRAWDAVDPLLQSPDPLVRIAAVRAAGSRAPAGLARDPCRDVRIALAQRYAIGEQLKDGNWRVRLASIRSHGRARIGPHELAPLLLDRNLALSAAAEEALREMPERACRPVAALLDPGNEAIWHYAPKLFERWGERAAGAVPDLVPLLAHANPTVREVAARCLASIGPSAKPASGALVAALGDARLPVVAHAALALGRIGVTDEVRRALSSETARVRAYAAFALGWALGAARGIDQVAYEPRLPVVDPGVADPGVTPAQVARLAKLPRPEAARLARRGMWSGHAAIANPCAAFLRHDEMSPLECERSIELAVAEGFREGHPFDFEHFRSTLGCNELPACLEYVRYTWRTSPKRRSLLGDLHRAPRSTNIPAILWFERNEGPFALWEFDNLWQPVFRTAGYRRELTRYWLGRDGPAVDVIRQDMGFYTPNRWWMEDEPIAPDDERLFLEIVAHHVREPGDDDDWKDTQALAAYRLLARGRAAASEPALWRAAEADSEPGRAALVALARRGDPIAIVRIVRDAAEDDDALALFVEMCPELAGPLLRKELADPERAARMADLVRAARYDGSYMLGAEWSFDPFLGLEPVVDTGTLPLAALVAIAQEVPGCRTARIGRGIVGRLEIEGFAPLRDEEEGLPEEQVMATCAFAWRSDPERFEALLRRWAGSDDAEHVEVALKCLLRVGHVEDARFAVKHPETFLRLADEEPFDAPRWVREFVETRQRRLLPADAETDAIGALLTLQCGFGLATEITDERVLEAMAAAVRGGRGAAFARKLLAEDIAVVPCFEQPLRPTEFPWMAAELQRRYDARERGASNERLACLAALDAGDARAEYWSAMRSGRYRWVVWTEGIHDLILGDELATLPHWRDELETNCCHLSGALESIFEDQFDIQVLYDCHDSGYGEPPSDRVLDHFELRGGDYVWNPLVRRFLPMPE